MIAVPPPAPVTVPVLTPTVATAGVPLLQVPPPPSDNVVANPLHIVPVPEMAPGNGLTVKVLEVAQPVADIV